MICQTFSQNFHKWGKNHYHPHRIVKANCKTNSEGMFALDWEWNCCFVWSCFLRCKHYTKVDLVVSYQLKWESLCIHMNTVEPLVKAHPENVNSWGAKQGEDAKDVTKNGGWKQGWYWKKNFLQLYCPNGVSPMRNLGCFPQGKPAATESNYPTHSACWVF